MHLVDAGVLPLLTAIYALRCGVPTVSTDKPLQSIRRARGLAGANPAQSCSAVPPAARLGNFTIQRAADGCRRLASAPDGRRWPSPSFRSLTRQQSIWTSTLCSLRRAASRSLTRNYALLVARRCRRSFPRFPERFFWPTRLCW